MAMETTKSTLKNNDKCIRLREFKEFLQHYNSGADTPSTILNAAGAELRITRNNNETYPVSIDELRAELIMIIWIQLQAKHCPCNFRLALLRTLLTKVESECRSSKECCLTTRRSTIDEISEKANEYDLAKLQKFVAQKLDELLTRLTDNAEAGNLSNYSDEGVLCVNGDACRCVNKDDDDSYVVGHIKNKPRKMEDRNICLERFSDIYGIKENYSFYGVFDGHSGPIAATYVVNQLPHLLAKQLKESNSDSIDNYREAFETAFLQVDKQFIEKRISSGTTAVCVLLERHKDTRQHLYIAWVGDSRALLVSAAVSLQLVKPHKPDTPDERKRIEDMGGSVMYVQGQWRVNGFLNVARSIGDYSVDAVVAEPDFVDVFLNENHDFLVLGTDGLFDHVTEAIIVDTIYAALADVTLKVEDIPKLLIELAKEGDSQDNITVVIVFLNKRSVIIEHYNKRDKSS